MAKKKLTELEVKQEKLKLLEEDIRLKKGLPHLYGFRDYKWSKEFKESTNKDCLLTAANQIGKSTSQIIKFVDWATDVKRWPELWPGREPRQFWYLYPTKEIATIEFNMKWVKDILPRNEFKDHPIYGWKDERRYRGDIHALHFNSGISCFFKTYAQDTQHLQAGSVDYVACDEELPEDVWDEINFRRMATNGYFSAVFTATLGQEFWRRAIEPKTSQEETFKDAWKKQVSLFDCRYFADGTPSHWSDERIARAISSCKSDAEVQRRIYGRFVLDSGLKYPSFSPKENVIEPFEIPSNWSFYCGVDIGAGGDDNHPPTIIFIAVRPDHKFGVVYDGWKGDDKIYTAGDVVEQYMRMVKSRPMHGLWYDYHCKDFGTIAIRNNLGFQPAEKKHDIGEHIMNTLFKSKMLMVFNKSQLASLVTELSNLKLDTPKRSAIDDMADGCRYGVVKIPWDFSDVGLHLDVEAILKSVTLSPQDELNKYRRDFVLTGDKKKGEIGNVEDEMEAWNELYETDYDHF